MRTERDNVVAKRLESRKPVRRAAVVVTVLAAAGGIAVYSGAQGAGAAPAPTISQVQNAGQQPPGQGRQDRPAVRRGGAAAGGREGPARPGHQAVRQRAAAVQPGQRHARRRRRDPVRELQPDVHHRAAHLGRPVRGAWPGVAAPPGRGHAQPGRRSSSSPWPTSCPRSRQQRQRTEDGVAQLEAAVRHAEGVDDQAARHPDVPAQEPAPRSSRPLWPRRPVGGSNTSSTVTTTPIAYTGPTATQAEQGGRVRLRADRQAVRVGRHRPELLRLLRPGAGRVGGGGRVDPADHVRPVGERCRTSRCPTSSPVT